MFTMISRMKGLRYPGILWNVRTFSIGGLAAKFVFGES